MSVKVLHVFGTMNRGGAEMRTVSLMSGMCERDIVFDYCTLSGQQGVLDPEIASHGGQVHPCRLSLTFPLRFIQLAKDYDVVHSHVAYVSGFILLLARMAGVRIRIAHFRNTTDGMRETAARRWRNHLLKFLIQHNANKILGVCAAALEGFIGQEWKENRKCQVVYNGLPIPKISTQSDFWKGYIPAYAGESIVINVARMDAPKNHLRQLQIFNSLLKSQKSAHLVFVGRENPTIKLKLEHYIKEQNLTNKVHFLGLRSNVLELVAHADAMLFPSLWEGLPGAVLEALSVGTPVVASDLPGVIEISQVTNGVHMLRLEDNDEIWAQTLESILSTQTCKEPIREAFASSPFQLETNLKKLYAIYAASK